MEASVRVAVNGHGTGRVGQGRVYGVLKTELRFEDRVNLGHGEVWIGVPVRCYMECNKRLNGDSQVQP